MPKHMVVLSDAARETAEYYSTPAALEQHARREITAALGRTTFKTFSCRRMRFDISFEHAGEPFTLMAKTNDLWLVETWNGEQPCPPYPIIFTDRATALVNGLGWNFDAIEQRARLALKSADPQDHGFCNFQVPIEEVPFIGRLNELDSVEVDLDDWAREHLGH